MLHSILLALAIGEPVAEPTDVPDTVAPVEDHAAVAAQAFRDGEFVRAAEAFQRAYVATGDPALLFGRAQALRRAGSCAAAIDVFEEFIATEPPTPDADAAQQSIDECRAILDAHSKPDLAPDPDPIDAPLSPPPPPPPKWHRDVTGGVLLGTGLVVAAIGSALYGSSFGLADDRGGTEQAYDDRRRRVRTLAATGGALLIGGGAIVIGAIIRYAVVAKRGRSSRVAYNPLVVRF